MRKRGTAKKSEVNNETIPVSIGSPQDMGNALSSMSKLSDADQVVQS